MAVNKSDKDESVFLTQSTFKSSEDDEKDFAFRFADPLTELDLDKELETCVPKLTKYKN